MRPAEKIPVKWLGPNVAVVFRLSWVGWQGSEQVPGSREEGLGLNSASAICWLVIGKRLMFLVPQFPHPYNGVDDMHPGTCSDVNEIMKEKRLAQGLAPQTFGNQQASSP